MGRKLKTTVHVDGQAYGPGDEVPDEIAQKIDNPDVWEDEGASQAQEVEGQQGQGGMEVPQETQDLPEEGGKGRRGKSGQL